MSKEGNVKSFDIQYKILLLGDTKVGKTSLQRVITGKDFRPTIGSTFGMSEKCFILREGEECVLKSFLGIDFVNRIVPVERANVNLQIW